MDDFVLRDDGWESFHRFRGCKPVSEFTMCPSSSPSSCPFASSVATIRFLSDFCTKPAVSSFFSRDGMAALLGGDAGVRRYVCLGGRLGKCDGNARSVGGIDGATLSSSDGSRAGDGERERGGIRVGVPATVRLFFLRAIFARVGRRDVGAILNSSQARTRSVAMAADLLERLAYWCARSYSRSMKAITSRSSLSSASGWAAEKPASRSSETMSLSMALDAT